MRGHLRAQVRETREQGQGGGHRTYLSTLDIVCCDARFLRGAGAVCASAAVPVLWGRGALERFRGWRYGDDWHVGGCLEWRMDDVNLLVIVDNNGLEARGLCSAGCPLVGVPHAGELVWCRRRYIRRYNATAVVLVVITSLFILRRVSSPAKKKPGSDMLGNLGPNERQGVRA